MNKKHYLILIFALLLSGCVTNKQIASHYRDNMAISPTLGGKLFTSAWQQRSAEYKALCIQAYNIATWRIEQLAAEKIDKVRPMAIVTDIDETFLDNSPYAVQQVLKGKDFDQASWDKWCEKATADTICGALTFFNRAQELGFTVFYITNRNEQNRRGTLLNMQKYGFPFADEDHLLTLSSESDKEPRRMKVREQYDIVLLLGDNLGDFNSLFDTYSEKSRDEAVVKFSAEFGKKFIVLPNPCYGTWEAAMTGERSTLQKRDSVLNTLNLK